MTRKTLLDLKNTGAAQRLGLAPCSPEFLALVNRSQETLSFMGRWWGTYQQLRLCPSGYCVAWPAQVMNVERLKRENEVISVRTPWYEWQQMVPPPSTDPDFPDCARNLLDRGTTPLFSDIVWTGNPKKLRIYASATADNGVRVLVQGLDINGNPVRTNDATAGWVDGEYVTITTLGVLTTYTYISITGIQKPVTKNRVKVYEYDTVALTERLVADYAASETNPAYRKTFLSGSNCGGDTANDEPDGCNTLPTCANQLLVAIVRLEALPVLVDSDWLLIQHLGALEDGMRAILYQSDKHLPLDAEPSMQLAVRKLRAELEARTGGPQQTIINVKPGPSFCRVFDSRFV